MEQTSTSNAADYRGLSFGQMGSRYLIGIDTGTTGEIYKAVTAVAATVVTLTQNKGDATLTSLPIPAGVTVYGRFTGITMVSGAVLAYIG